ncbi:MAG: choice-of-anchor J domain-containing protein, partial [Muribaculaceae bacterium]|nr:choice-of-anchor J domain-containing protein [Muribaculaceae bacterium]
IHIATVDGSLDELVGTISSEAGSGWITLSFTVPDKFNNKGAAYAYIRSSFPSAAEYIMVSGFSIHKKEANDLGIAQFEVSPVTVGSEGTVTATVHNYGFNSAKVSSLVAVITDMYAKEVAKVTLNGTVSTLASGEDATYTGSFTLNKMEYAGSTMTVTATLAPSDDNATNNIAIATFMPASVKAPVVTDLRGELNEAGNGISLRWSNPVEGRRTEGFEAVAHGDYSSLISGWTNIDFDRKEEWGLEEVQIPNGGLAKGFQVLSASALNQALGGEGFAAHSGDRFLISFSVAEGQSDDWFISPEIKGEDGFSFWAGIFDPSFPETFEVLYSTSDADLDSFEVLESVTKRTNTWEPFSYDLPEGTRYVAIHYCSNDQFALLLDDFTYTATDSEFTVESYVVYRNGVSVATVTDTAYEDIVADAAHQTYNVAVIATDADGNKKEYPLGNSYCFATSGLSDISAAESADGEWFTLQGVRVAAPQAPGVYIYRTASATVKVVR